MTNIISATASPPDAAALLASRVRRYEHFETVNRPYLSWQIEQFAPYLGQRILEIGVGIGGIMDVLGKRERLVGMDVEPEVLEFATERFRDRPECRFVLSDIAELSPEVRADLRAEKFDSIVCLNVLEHIRDDIGALQQMEELLVPGGVLALLMPAHLALYGPYDKTDGHYRRYSKPYLRTILKHTGFAVEKLRYFNAVGAVGWWVQYRLLQRSIHGEGQLGAMNMVLPIVRQVEKWISPPFGLSVIAVCRKGHGQ